MSGAISASTLLAATAITTAATVGASIYTGRKQDKASRRGYEQAQRQADAQAKQADEAMNRENRKSADSGAFLGEAALAGKAGQSGTMLTGTQGVSPDLLNLGKNTLLGQ